MDKLLDFPMEMFLESDSVLLTNRMIIATVNIIKDNCETISTFNNSLQDQNDSIEYLEKTPKAEKQQSSNCRNVNFYEDTISAFSCEEYKARFKMKKSTCQVLINFLKDFQRNNTSVVPLDKKVHIFLWLLTSEVSFSEASRLFGLHKSTIAYIFHEISSLMSENKDHFICWPTREQQHMTSVKVQSSCKFPNCVGFIDTCSFKVGARSNSLPETVLLQAVCDESLMFTDIHIGTVGVTRKSKVFKESALSSELNNHVDFNYHILGDLNYKLRKCLMIPFNSNEKLTSREIIYNNAHQNARVYIGCALMLLKSKFAKLQHIDVTKPEALNNVITAACILHNFILLHEGSPCIKQENVVSSDIICFDRNIVNTALEKRKVICDYLNITHVT